MIPPAVNLPELRVEIDADALTVNLRAARAAWGADYVVDLRRDAWGHGIELAARLARAAGIIRAAADPAARDKAASAGLMPVDLISASEADSIGDGAEIYGLHTGATPVMAMYSRVLATKCIQAGDGVSYGYRYRAPAATSVALVTGGYAQGIARALGGEIDVDINGTRRRVVGRIAMDVCVVDVVDAAHTRAGDDVIFFGGGAVRHELDRWASVSGLRPAEFVSLIGSRARRVVTESDVVA